jgi:hypothetical protein
MGVELDASAVLIPVPFESETGCVLVPGRGRFYLDFDYNTFLSQSSVSWHTFSSDWREVSPAVSDPLILRSLQNRTDEFEVSDGVPWSHCRIGKGETRLIPLHKFTMHYRLKWSVIAKVCHKNTCRWNGFIWPADRLSVTNCHVIARIVRLCWMLC